MKHQRLLGLMMAAACAGPWACSGTDSRSLPRDGSGDTPDMAPAGDGGVGGDAGPQQAVCPDGTPVVHHSLTPRPSLPPLGALDLPGLLPATIIVSAKDGTSDSMRFDLCQGAGGLALHALLIRDDGAGVIRFVVDGTITSPTMGSVQIPEGPAFEVRVPRTAAIVEGLQEAVGGNLRALRIRLLGDTGLLVVGHTDFLAVARGKVGVASIEYTSLYVLIGGLAPGNVFAGLRCSIVESSLTTSFRLDTAQFEVEACTGQGGGFTTAFRILRLTVQDSNPDRGRGQQRHELQVEPPQRVRLVPSGAGPRRLRRQCGPGRGLRAAGPERTPAPLRRTGQRPPDVPDPVPRRGLAGRQRPGLPPLSVVQLSLSGDAIGRRPAWRRSRRRAATTAGA
jgi:hypothetical protein